MSEYISRNRPVITGVANTNLPNGTAVQFAADGYLYQVTASTDPWIGVVADFENAVDGITNSGSVVNVILRGAGAITTVFAAGAVTKGAALIVTGSNGGFKAGSVSVLSSGSSAVTPDNVFIKCDAFALAAGAANDYVYAVLV